jgi:hypothetical protein
MINTLDFIWTDASLGTNISSLTGNTILTKLYWLLGRKSKLDLNNKLLIYKAAIKPIWTLGIQLWGTASTSKIEIMERFQSKALLLITDGPRYVPNAVIRNDLQIPTIKEEITHLSSK